MRWMAVLAVLAGGCAAPEPRSKPAAVLPAAPEWAEEGRQAVQLLRELIQFDTINPPQPGSKKANANETALLAHVKGILAQDGVASEILESAPGRGNLVARFRGTGEKGALLLMAHVDVVNVDPLRWEVDPLSGLVKDGVLWGRGALDDKDDAAVFVQVLRILSRRKVPLKRDVILMLNADEESSGRFGAKWIVDNHWDKVACEFVLNEGGRAVLKDGKATVFGFQTAEKIYNDFRLWVRGESGHSSIPRPRNALYEAARLLAKLEQFKTPLRLNDTTKAYFAGLAGSPDFQETREWLEKTGAGNLEAAEELTKNPRFNALLRSTFVPTMVKGGIRENVLPPDVEINFNVRLLPGDKIDDLIKGLLSYLELTRVEIVECDPTGIDRWKAQKKDVDAALFLVDRGVDAPASSMETDMYRALEAAAKKLAPGALVVPQMSTGATDSRFFREKGVACYGLSPCPTGEAEEKTVHDHNERVPVDSVAFGVQFIYEAVLEAAR